MTLLRLLAILPFLATTACSYSPVIDMEGVDAAQYERDRTHCETLAENANTTSHVAGQAATSTLLGAALGTLTGAITGNTRVGAIGGGAGGAATGITQGYQHSAQMKSEIVKKCLSKRGYSVLN